MLFIHILIHIF